MEIDPVAFDRIQSILGRKVPNAFVEVIFAENMAPERVQALSELLTAFDSKHQVAGSRSNTAYDNLLTLLHHRDIGRYFLAHPQALMSYVEQIRKVTGYGAHNTFFTLALEHVGRMFVEDPEIFLELAVKTADESIGAFPSLKGATLFRQFQSAPQAVISQYTHIVNALAHRAGTVLNQLYEESLAQCFVEDGERFLNILIAIAEKYASQFTFDPFSAFNKKAFLPTFAAYFHSEISEKEFFEALEAYR